jgi:membrane protein insertase Oxa1/YidC/SpoIIIJ
MSYIPNNISNMNSNINSSFGNMHLNQSQPSRFGNISSNFPLGNQRNNLPVQKPNNGYKHTHFNHTVVHKEHFKNIKKPKSLLKLFKKYMLNMNGLAIILLFILLLLFIYRYITYKTSKFRTNLMDDTGLLNPLYIPDGSIIPSNHY